MHDWEYSDAALNVRNDFLGVSATIYVEGDDDVVFWGEVFSQVTDEVFNVEALGGSDRVESFARKIQSGMLAAIVAMDLDLSGDPR